MAERYPNQEVVMVLHRERCRADATDRYAVHLGINRSDRKPAEGSTRAPPERRRHHAWKTVRTLDERYGLRQQARQGQLARPREAAGRAERDMARKGQAERSENARVRVAVARRIEEVRRMRDCPDRMGELERRLRRDGIELAKSKGRSLQSTASPQKSLGAVRKVNGGRLGFAVDRSTGITVRFTLRGIATAMRAFWELERRALENQNGRDD